MQQDHTVCQFFTPQKLLLCQSCFYSASFPFCSFFLTDPLLMLQTTCNLVSLDCTGLQGATLPDLLNYTTMYNFSSLYSESGYSRYLVLGTDEQPERLPAAWSCLTGQAAAQSANTQLLSPSPHISLPKSSNFPVFALTLIPS